MSLTKVFTLSVLSELQDLHIIIMSEANGEPNNEQSMMQVDYLIVGTGPAGASLAAFMASYGKQGTLSPSSAPLFADKVVPRDERPHCEPRLKQCRYSESTYHQHGCNW